MREENPLNPGESELEAALARLAPTPALACGETIAYEAGRRAGQRRTIAWRTCSGALAAALAVTVMLRPTPRPDEHLVYAPAPPIPQPTVVNHLDRSDAPVPLPGSYLSVRDVVLAHGVGVLPKTSGGAAPGEEPTRAVSIHRHVPIIPSLFGEQL
jgi:hypothetical protein